MSNTKAELKPGEYIEESKEFTLDDFKRVEREMNKLTKEERQWLHDKFYGTDIGVSEDSFNYFLKEIEQKKKEWQEEAIRNYLEGETEDALCLD